MPQATTRTRAGKANGAAPTPPALTEYIVLERVGTGISTPEQPHPYAWQPVLNQTAEQGPDGEPRVFKASGKAAAIRMHTGDGADVIEGTWKAVPVSSWKGGETTRRVTASERLPLDTAV